MVPVVVMRPRVVLVLAAIVGLVVVVWTLLAPSGMAKLDRLRTEEQRLADEVAQKKAENARLVDDIQKLQGDTDASRLSIEKRARDELGYVAPGEVVLQVPVSAASPPATASSPPTSTSPAASPTPTPEHP
jgi:cell division protein FtsB